MAEIVEPVAKGTTGRRIAAENLYRQARELLGKASTGGESLQPGVRQSVRHHVDYRGEAGVVARQGERTIERLLSASVTCRLQGRSLFAYLTHALCAKIRGDPIPLLG